MERVRPVLFVHVSGSGGTTLCRQASQQPGAGRFKVGQGFNCLLSCKNPDDYALYGLHHQTGLSRSCTSHQGIMASNCTALQAAMHERGFRVLGATETMLDEANSRSQPTDIHALVSSLRKTCTGACCHCTSPSIFGGCGGQPVAAQRLPDGRVGAWCKGPRNGMVAIRDGDSSPFDRLWSLSAWEPLSTLCPNIRYVFLMNEPLKRLATQLLYRCPWAHHVDSTLNASCLPWALDTLQAIYAHELLLDDARSLFCGTPAASNYYLRSLLGPRVFFARLRALGDDHLAAAKRMLHRFEIVAPTYAISSLSTLLHLRLHWPNYHFPNAPVYLDRFMHKVHTLIAPYREPFTQAATETLHEHNRLDLQLYSWVGQRLQDDLHQARQLQA